MRYNGIVPVYSLLTTEFTIKQKAVGNKGDKIFLSENIYDSSYFRERKRDRIREKESEREREGGRAQSLRQRFLRGKRPVIVHRSPNPLFIGIRE